MKKVQLFVTCMIDAGPRRPGDPDGPEELHVVLVDNGRTRILASEYAEMLTCIRCGACLNACPVSRLIGGHAYDGAVAGLADTGSIVVASGPGRSRLASLLPAIRVAVLPLSRLYPTMQDWLAGGGVELARRTANLVVITGSSRTSDIEMQLTLGMHGPKEIHVVLFRDQVVGRK